MRASLGSKRAGHAWTNAPFLRKDASDRDVDTAFRHGVTCSTLVPALHLAKPAGIPLANVMHRNVARRVARKAALPALVVAGCFAKHHFVNGTDKPARALVGGAKDGP